MIRFKRREFLNLDRPFPFQNGKTFLKLDITTREFISDLII